MLLATLAGAFYGLSAARGLLLATLKRVYKFFHCNLILDLIFVQLVLDILRYCFCVLSGRVYIIASAPKLSIPIFVLQICMSFIDNQSTFPF